MEFVHKPVMLAECIEALDIKPDGIYLDGTLGGGGHSYEIARRLTEGGRLIAFDKDEDAHKAARERLKDFTERIVFVRDDFKNACAVLDELGIGRIDGVLLDLGVSSYQLDNAERGFSYVKDAPLDMRMDRGQRMSAYEVVNTYSAEELTRIFREYGEEKLASKIAARIVKIREEKPIATTLELSAIRSRRSSHRTCPQTETRRQNGGYHFPLAGRQNRQKRFQGTESFLHVPARFPRVRVRQNKRSRNTDKQADYGRR